VGSRVRDSGGKLSYQCSRREPSEASRGTGGVAHGR
jgi:hypothetical protein